MTILTKNDAKYWTPQNICNEVNDLRKDKVDLLEALKQLLDLLDGKIDPKDCELNDAFIEADNLVEKAKGL